MKDSNDKRTVILLATKQTLRTVLKIKTTLYVVIPACSSFDNIHFEEYSVKLLMPYL